MSHDEHTSASGVTSRVIGFFESIIYLGRWLLIPMYVGLVATLAIYAYRFCVELYHLCAHLSASSDAELMLGVLGLLDSAMIGNLLLFTTLGSYSIFVRKLSVPEHDQPNWLKTITSGTLKTKLSTSLIGISSVHLLRDFISAETNTPDLFFKHCGVHMVFLVSTLVLAYVDRAGHPAHGDGQASTH